MIIAIAYLQVYSLSIHFQSNSSPSIHSFTNALYINPLIQLSIHSSIHPFIINHAMNPLIQLYIHSFIHRSIYQSFHLFIYQSFHPTSHSHIHPSINSSDQVNQFTLAPPALDPAAPAPAALSALTFFSSDMIWFLFSAILSAYFFSVAATISLVCLSFSANFCFVVTWKMGVKSVSVKNTLPY